MCVLLTIDVFRRLDIVVGTLLLIPTQQGRRLSCLLQSPIIRIQYGSQRERV